MNGGLICHRGESYHSNSMLTAGSNFGFFIFIFSFASSLRRGEVYLLPAEKMDQPVLQQSGLDISRARTEGKELTH
jgi:hypothetical protein